MNTSQALIKITSLLFLVFPFLLLSEICFGEKTKTQKETVPIKLESHFSPKEQKILDMGLIPRKKHTSGVVASVFIGFGLGQEIQGRPEAGLAFTIIDSFAAVGLLTGTISTSENPFFLGSLWLIAISKVVSIGDTIVGPNVHNEKYRKLKARQNKIKEKEISFQFHPVLSQKGAPGAGVTLRF